MKIILGKIAAHPCLASEKDICVRHGPGIRKHPNARDAGSLTPIERKSECENAASITLTKTGVTQDKKCKATTQRVNSHRGYGQARHLAVRRSRLDKTSAYSCGKFPYEGQTEVNIFLLNDSETAISCIEYDNAMKPYALAHVPRVSIDSLFMTPCSLDFFRRERSCLDQTDPFSGRYRRTVY